MKELTAYDRYQERQRIAEEQHIQRAIQKAVQAEREACARVCENIERNGAWITKEEAAAAIRMRGER